jgi:hypothetical protein
VHLIVSFVGVDGAAVEQRTVALVPNRSMTLRIPGPDRSGRLLVRAAISIDPFGANPPDDGLDRVGGNPPDDGLDRVGGNPPDDNLDGVAATLEIVDVLTGRSQAIVSPLRVLGFNPQPEPPAAL